MAESWQNVVSDAHAAFPGVPLYTDAMTIRVGNRIHRELCEEFRLQMTSVDISLTTTDREYSLSENHVAIWSADYLTSATAQPLPLYPTSVDELDAEQAGWRNPNLQGIPQWFYTYADNNSAGVVGFDRIPSTATTAGYPTVRLYVSVYTALTSSSNLPAVLRTPNVYIMGLCAAFAQLRDPERFAYFSEQYEQEKNKLAAYIARRQRNNDPRVVPMVNAGIASR